MKKIKLVFVIALVIFNLSACEEEKLNKTNNKDSLKIYMLNSKRDIQVYLEEAAKKFSKSNKDIEIEIITTKKGEKPFEKLSSMYSSGEAPTIAMLDGNELNSFKEKAVDLTDEDWVNDANFLESCKIDNKVIAFPFMIEGCGLIYNKKVLDKANIDPRKIDTRNKLEIALKNIQETGNSGCVIGQMDWSLGDNYSLTYLANKSKNINDITKYKNKLKNGEIKISEDEDFINMMYTFTMMKKYNKAKDDPMSADYNKCIEYIANDEVGFYFQRNFVWSDMERLNSDKENFGFIPMPISDDSLDIANSSLQVGISKFIVLDKELSDIKKQKAAKKFLNWLVYDTEGQEILIKRAKIIMAFKNVKIEPNDPLGKGIVNFIKEEKTILYGANLVPLDHWKMIGPSYQKFLIGKNTLENVSQSIEKYWKNIN
ncbi:MAG: ABC transporter substrate-binding protein [Clostridiales bacterium]